MKMRSVCLPPGRLQPGMMTAAAILAHQGEELLPTGCILDAAMIDGIRRRLIHCVMVSLPDTRDAAQIAREIEIGQKRLAYIFRGGGSESRAELHRAASQFRYRQSQ